MTPLESRRAARSCTLTVLVASVGGSACDESRTPGEPPRSRVQAVVASAAAAPPTPPPTAAAASAPSKTTAARPPLCDGQLDAPGQPFQPAREPTQASAAGQEHLPPRAVGRSSRWTWVNFWAAWCVPCKEELPLLLSWQKKLQSRLDMVFVSFDDDSRQLDRFLSDQPEDGLQRSYWLPEGAERTAWLEALKLDSEPELPMQLLIDPKGQLRCKIQGAVDERDLPALEQIVAAK